MIELDINEDFSDQQQKHIEAMVKQIVEQDFEPRIAEYEKTMTELKQYVRDIEVDSNMYDEMFEATRKCEKCSKKLMDLRKKFKIRKSPNVSLRDTISPPKPKPTIVRIIDDPKRKQSTSTGKAQTPKKPKNPKSTSTIKKHKASYGPSLVTKKATIPKTTQRRKPPQPKTPEKSKSDVKPIRLSYTPDVNSDVEIIDISD